MRTLKLHCDASAYRLDGCLEHNNSEKPAACVSHTLTKSETAYAQMEDEGLTLVFGVH